jgi:AcrR family transcriptional regulator
VSSRTATKGRQPSRGTRASRLPAAERLEQILDSAAAAFAARSYRDVSTADIATAAGVSEPTLYRYYDSKRALYLAVLDRSSDALAEKWRAIIEASATPLEGLRAAGRWYFLQMVENPQPLLLRGRSLVETGDDEVAKHARERFLETFNFIKRQYDDAKERGLIDAACDTRAYTWLFMSVGTLLDQGLLMKLKGELDLEQIRGIMAIIDPTRPAPAEAAPAPADSRRSARTSTAR